ncbi:1,4-alpha-glucan branching protein GlgB (plasmid) [Rhizobium ruizarguesonis]|uniref:1,4-alpha-glucan branching enzyme GlgB n=1 Tax=Rhizobium ruizarguesonis TaxID=2081791 RepID=A0ABY1X2N7_9HYPH|nr:1,4-alpha-glucan branching protein GlgB [Rhizobium ruizarguesonis]QJS31156.1 1,4-alpha-glucan branching protein GlgB [Rhizobium leguminosarum bv. trifolii TA1]TBY58169.1 1,4-alpha-glucan branching protein GlgB [Rhizobium leguminosarum bv. viciae]NEJ14864.1 1,4-alpha-glucan branching protein GlgB [Rhizobium ruizarguesonis]NEK28939.1 1,4-alpha-glucan branching protein GlgB [Rhizobium ruizarguesonis]TAU72296.1 1,4-alpha-glucan branching protein GlgB [Rhizobium ruizarguesonis]
MNVERSELLAGIGQDALWALIEGRHGDPFSILGPHESGGMTIVRVYLPGAEAIDLIDATSDRVVTPFSIAHPSGLFAAAAASRTGYRLRITWPDAVQITEDPYSFGLLLGELDLHLISEGTHYSLSRTLGAVDMSIDGISGVRFAVWAPNARRVSVVGDFNAWDGRRNPMRLRQSAGVWELFIPRLAPGERYKFEIVDAQGTCLPQKADPVARASEAAPSTASIVASSTPFRWTDDGWMKGRSRQDRLEGALSVYEVHAGSWLRDQKDGNRSLDWVELSQRLVPYVRDMGFTHIELLPIMEHPFGGSWGYQPLGLFAPTGRYGTPEDFAYFIDRCHGAGLGVILDWVPAHFPTDVWGLARFDGSALYEHEDPREGFHRDWNTLIYNLGRKEVKGFLIASALEWLERYHIDGLRVDAVASMLYRDYSRNEGEWIPNQYGGRENLEAVEFFKHLNSIIHERCPHAMTIAEESTAWPGVTKPPEQGGLGFDIKWNMGWMHDSLSYIEKDPIYRSYAHGTMTFGMLYAYSEHFILPISHDEVVYGKGSLLTKMPGDEWQKFANLRSYLAFMWGHPGKKLLFMGSEVAQPGEWNHDGSVTWDVLDRPQHVGIQRLVKDLNGLYGDEPALQFGDFHPEGFEWAAADDAVNSVLGMLRYALGRASSILVMSNFTPVPRYGYRVGVPSDGVWIEKMTTDAREYGGSGLVNGAVSTEPVPAHGRAVSLSLTLPPLSTIFLQGPSP